MFGSNNYLGAISNHQIIDKTISVIKEFGIGSGGVPVLSGTSFHHDKLERTISNFTGFEDTMLFSSGFTANLGAILGLIRVNMSSVLTKEDIDYFIEVLNDLFDKYKIKKNGQK